MKYRFFPVRLCCLILAFALLAGCGAGGSQTTEPVPTVTDPPAPTAPADGSPDDVTCRGSYTGQVEPGVVVARCGEVELYAGMLQLYYGMEVSSWRQSGATPAPDWSLPLDVQLCPLEGTAVTWQQFFLDRALNTWHNVQALIQVSYTAPFPLDPEYLPNENLHSTYFNTSYPANLVLYGTRDTYWVNSMHQSYIDGLPQTLMTLAQKEGYTGTAGYAVAIGGQGSLGENLLYMARDMNYAYAYFTYERTLITRDEEAAVALAQGQDGENLVTFRHIIMLPEEDSEYGWRQLQLEAQNDLRKIDTEGEFAIYANANSKDEGSRLNGGLYEGIAQGFVYQELDDWLFDPARKPGDMEMFRTDLGLQVVYFCKMESSALPAARNQLMAQEEAAIFASAREAFPMTVTYENIVLNGDAGTAGSWSELIYPDIAHEHIPEVPLYLQQDFAESDYGNAKIGTSGCGITTLAMLVSYTSDTWQTPNVLADKYASYHHPSGTDGMLMIHAGPEYGYYVSNRTFKFDEVYQALEDGYMVINVQVVGYFTRGGHYLLLHHLWEDGTVSIRDSNIYNYAKLEEHQDDHFPFKLFKPSSAGFWVLEGKITRIPACYRCGGETGLEPFPGLIQGEYTCPKCIDALARRTGFMTLCPRQ